MIHVDFSEKKENMSDTKSNLKLTISKVSKRVEIYILCITFKFDDTY